MSMLGFVPESCSFFARAKVSKVNRVGLPNHKYGRPTPRATPTLSRVSTYPYAYLYILYTLGYELWN